MEPALPRFIRFGREICGDLARAEGREWWLADGRGGYAAGTIAGTLTRRYHGLLVAPLRASPGRALVFSKADATLTRGTREWPLHTNRWAGGVVEPRGYLHLESFHLDGRLPVWRYALGSLRLEARIWMGVGASSTYLAWRLLAAPEDATDLRLWVRLLVNARDHHGETAAGAFAPHVEAEDSALRVSLPGDTTLHFRSRCGRFHPETVWMEHFDLPLERERGLADQDNHLCVGRLVLPLPAGEWVGFVASLEDLPGPYLQEALRQRRQWDGRLLRQALVQSGGCGPAPDWIQQLVLAADGFLVERPSTAAEGGTSVIAGYPWFGEWGRDTFIALPGLTLATRRQEVARNILERWIPFVDRGMLPNCFPEDGAEPAYNSVDAALWYVEAWRAYLAASRDIAALRRHYPVLAGIIEHHRRGTRHGIAVDPADGLLRAGEEGVQLTWMDAKVGDWVVTPRTGKAVEVNALWYNALVSMADFADRLGADATPYRALAEQARTGFGRFLRADGRGLMDVLDGPGGDDDRLRPNQILAVSLTHSPLAPAARAAVVRSVGRALLTSHGLRTLDPTHPEYRPVYAGDVRARDAAYHQGPAWGWLLGHYALALYRVSGDAELARACLEPVQDHLRDAGLGTVSELFDADPPHTPRGTPSQAWSVACTLEAWCRLDRARPGGKEDPRE